MWKDFNAKAIHAWPNLEEVDKQRVFNTLKSATAKCEKKQYEKGKISFELLGQIDPGKVEQASKHAKRLLDELRGKKPESRSTLSC